MKENKAFRIPFITKKQLKSRQTLHIIFLKPQCKVQSIQSILFWCSLFIKNISTPRLEPKNGKQYCYHPCTSRLASRLTLTFIRHLTLINSNLIKLKKSLLFRIKFEQFHIFSAHSKLQCVFALYIHFSL